MIDPITREVEFYRSVCEETSKILSEHDFKENLQIPHLHLAVIAKLKIIDGKRMKDADSFIRIFINNHGDYAVSRGAKGGVMPIAKMQAKQALKEAKEQAKLEIEAEIELEVKEKQNEK